MRLNKEDFFAAQDVLKLCADLPEGSDLHISQDGRGFAAYLFADVQGSRQLVASGYSAGYITTSGNLHEFADDVRAFTRGEKIPAWKQEGLRFDFFLQEKAGE